MIVHRLETTYACAIITTNDQGDIIDAANPYRWMIGRELENRIAYLKGKGQYVGLMELR
jgi:hypothetical protein